MKQEYIYALLVLLVVVGIAGWSLMSKDEAPLGSDGGAAGTVLEGSGINDGPAGGQGIREGEPNPGAPGGFVPPVEETSDERRISPAELAVKVKAAEETGIAPDDVTVVSARNMDWPNACLGLETADEMCAQMITSGFEVTVKAGTKTMTYRTNEDGTVVRKEK